MHGDHRYPSLRAPARTSSDIQRGHSASAGRSGVLPPRQRPQGVEGGGEGGELEAGRGELPLEVVRRPLQRQPAELRQALPEPVPLAPASRRGR